MRLWPVLVLLAGPVWAQPAPGLRLVVEDDPVLATAGARPGCDSIDKSDAPARAVRTASGEVQLYASHFLTRVEAGPDLLHLRHRCPVVLRGGENDDPAAYDDRVWITALWTSDGRTIWAALHDEYQGDRRPAGCPTRRYMDCWYNAVTAAVSHDAGQTYTRAPGPALIATLPYRYDEVGPGHHGYFNPTGIVTSEGIQYMMLFATQAGAQRPGNCLLRTADVATPASWRAWDGAGFGIAFASPYAQALQPKQHVCAPVAVRQLRWPVTSLVRHVESGLFVATMFNAGAGGGVFYATSPDLLTWSEPERLLPAIGLGAWHCNDPAPLAYPSLLDPESTSRVFDTIGPHPSLFATRFNPSDCRAGPDRDLIRWVVRVESR